MSGGPVFDEQGKIIGIMVAASVRRGRIHTVAPEVLQATERCFALDMRRRAPSRRAMLRPRRRLAGDTAQRVQPKQRGSCKTYCLPGSLRMTCRALRYRQPKQPECRGDDAAQGPGHHAVIDHRESTNGEREESADRGNDRCARAHALFMRADGARRNAKDSIVAMMRRDRRDGSVTPAKKTRSSEIAPPPAHAK